MTHGTRTTTALDVGLVVAATVLVVAVVMIHVADVVASHGRRQTFVDWWTYRDAVLRLLDGQSIYAPTQLAGPYQLTHVVLVGYAYPPAAVPLFLPFASYPLGLAAFLTVNLGLFIGSLWALVTKTWPAARLRAFAVVLAGLAAFPPFSAAVLTDNVNLGLAGLVGFAVIGFSDRAAGAAGAAAALTKFVATPLALAAQNKRRAVVFAVAGSGLIALATLPWVGIQSWLDFVKALSLAQPDCSGARWIGLECLLAPSLGFGLAELVGVAVAGVCVVALLWVRDPLAMGGLVVLAIMAPTHDLHLHYWLLTYVLALGVVARLWPSIRRRLPGQPGHGSMSG